MEVESAGTIWSKDLWPGPGPCCFLFLTETWRGQDMIYPLQRLWKLLQFLVRIVVPVTWHTFSRMETIRQDCCWTVLKCELLRICFATGTCWVQDHLAGLPLWEGAPKGRHQRYNHMKVLIFLWDIISIIFFTRNPLWYSWPWRTCSRQGWVALVLGLWLMIFEGLP